MDTVRVRLFLSWIEHDGAPAFLGAVTGALSFSHIRDLALRHSQTQWQADLYPVAVDAVLLYALGKVLKPGLSATVRVFAWLVFLGFCGASLAANLLDAPAHDWTGLFVAVLPSGGFLAATVLRRVTAPPAAVPAAAVPVVPEPERERERERERRPAKRGTRAAASEVLGRALAEFRAAQPTGTGKQFAEFANGRLSAAELPTLSPRTLGNRLYAART